MKNQKVILQLQQSGDNLETPRKVEHWSYFKSIQGVDCFLHYCMLHHYKFTQEHTGAKNEPYKVHFYRTDKVDLASITQMTLELEKQSKACSGRYDGWATTAIK